MSETKPARSEPATRTDEPLELREAVVVSPEGGRGAVIGTDAEQFREFFQSVGLRRPT